MVYGFIYQKSEVSNTHLLINLADLFIRAEDQLHSATARGPDDLLYGPNDTDVWEVLRSLEEVLFRRARKATTTMKQVTKTNNPTKNTIFKRI